MDNQTIAFYFTLILFAVAYIGWVVTWKKKEKYKRTIAGRDGLESLKVNTLSRFPTRPFLTEWLHNRQGEHFRVKDVVRLTTNPNGTVNFVFADGHSINTGLNIKEAKIVLGIYYSCLIEEELDYKMSLWKKD